MNKSIATSPPFLPFTTIFILTALITICFIGLWVPEWASQKLPLQMKNIVLQYEIWRIFTSWFYEPSVPILAIGTLYLGWILAKFERSNSSAVAFNDFIINSLSHSLFFFLFHIPLTFLLSLETSLKFTFVSTWLNFAYKTSYYNQDIEVMIPFIRIGVSLRYFPIIAFVVVCGIAGQFRADAVFGLLLSILECWVFKGGIILFTKDTYFDKQKYFGYLGVTKLCCWVPIREELIIENHRLTVDSSQFYGQMWERPEMVGLQNQEIMNERSQVQI